MKPRRQEYPMEAAEILKREVKVLVFDQYGTVVDMQQGLTVAVTPFLKQKGWDGRPHSLSPGGGARTSRTR